jgi:hypothetical protein
MVDMKIGCLSNIDIYSGGGIKVMSSSFRGVSASQGKIVLRETNKQKKVSRNSACLFLFFFLNKIWLLQGFRG